MRITGRRGAWYSRRDRYWQFFAGLSVFFLSMALGGNTPLYHIVYAIVPGTMSSRGRPPSNGRTPTTPSRVSNAEIRARRLK